MNQLEVNDPYDPVAQDYIFNQHLRARTIDVGADLAPHYRPHELISKPPSPKDITLELLMASQAHIGHATSLWNPSNAKYIFGVRGVEDPIHVISLDVTAAYLRRACKIVRGVIERGGLVLFVGTRAGQAQIVEKAAELAGGCHLFNKWIPGSITNGQQILGSCRKKVVDENDVEVLGFGDQLERSSALKPDLVVCLNPLENYILLHECGLHNIPTIGIIDTDANPTWVTYPIPANDDSLRCVQVICGTLGRAGQEGLRARLKMADQGIVTSMQDHGLEQPSPGQAQREMELREREAMLAQQEYNEQGQVVEVDQEEAALPAPQRFSKSEEDEDSQSDRPNQSYQRDRPLSRAKSAQAPEEGRRLVDWEVAEMEQGNNDYRS